MAYLQVSLGIILKNASGLDTACLHGYSHSRHRYANHSRSTETYMEEAMSWNVIVNADKCTGDGECVDICPVEVYELQGSKAVPVKAEECLGCESCVEVCPSDAITVEEA